MIKSLSTDRLWGFTGSMCDQVPEVSGASGDDGLSRLKWFWGFSVGGEKVPGCPLSSCPVSHWAFDCDFGC